jgi:osmoprotectant transport system permease protein
MSTLARGRVVIPNPVLALLAATIFLAAIAFGYVTVAPNRLLSGRPVPIWHLVDAVTLAALVLELALLAIAVVLPPSRGLQAAAAGAASLLVVTLVWAAGSAAHQAMLTAGTPAARVSLGAGFWLMGLAAALAAADALDRLRAAAAVRFALALAVAAAIVAMARAGRLDDLSLAREFANRGEAFASELARHVWLVLAALAPALVIGSALGALALRRPARAGTIFAALNIVQTIPSIALFALMIAPLTALSEAAPLLRTLGLRGIGPAPAIIALTAYGLLPVARSVHAGFSGVPAAVVDAARGMGMSRLQILRDVTFPLALPVLLAGLRIVTLQLIGLAVVAALIGAGGLGTFVFQGLGQTATDLVLLGALSAIALALFADGLLRSLSDLAGAR